MKISKWMRVGALSLVVILGAAQVTSAQYTKIIPPPKNIPYAPIIDLKTVPPPPGQIPPPPAPGGAGGQYPQIQALPPTSAVPPNYPSEPPINNPFSNMEKVIFDAVRSSTNQIFTSGWYANFVWLSVIGVVFLALFRILWRSAGALAGGTPEGVVKFVLFDSLWVLFITQLSLHPQFLMEPIFSAFEYFNALGDQLLYDQTNGAATITSLLNGVANTVAGGYSNNPFGVVNYVVWGITLLALLALAALFYFQFITGVVYLYFVMPFLIRPALAGLLTKPTEGWFPNVINTGLNQMLKPLIGKAFIWFTFSILNLAVQQVPKVTGGGGGFDEPFAGSLNNAPARSVTVLAIYLMVLSFGVLLQLSVPTVAKIFSITINGVGSDLSEDLGGRAFRLALGAIRTGFAFGGAVSQLRGPNFELPKGKGGLKKAAGKPKVVDGELINESSGGSGSRIGVDKQFQGGSPKLLTDGSTPRSNNNSPSGFSGDGGPSSRRTWRRSKNGETYAEFSDIPSAPEPREAAAPPSGDALVTEPPEGATKTDREVINAFPGDEDIKQQRSASQTNGQVDGVVGRQSPTSDREVINPFPSDEGVKQNLDSRPSNGEENMVLEGEKLQQLEQVKSASSRVNRKDIKTYNDILTSYDNDLDRQKATGEIYGGSFKVNVTNAQDIDGGASPELRDSLFRPTFYTVWNGDATYIKNWSTRDFLVLPMPGKNEIQSDTFRSIYDVKGDGSEIKSIQEPAQFYREKNGTFSLVKKGSLTSGGS